MNTTTLLQRERQADRANDEYEGVLGNGSGNPYAGKSHYWVRFANGTDENGLTKYSTPRPIRYLGGNIIVREDVEVLVYKHPYDGEETISTMRPGYFTETGIDSRVMNPGDPVNKWWDSPNFIRWLNRTTGSSSGSTATLVTTRENPFYWNDALDWAQDAATTPANQLDLASYIPAVDTHRLVITYKNVVSDTIEAVGSTAKALSTALDFDDYLECRGLLPHNECVPLTAYELADGQTAIDANALLEDLRSWIALPQVIGFPNPIPDGKAWLLRSTHQQVVYDLTVEGNLIIQGDMVVL